MTRKKVIWGIVLAAALAAYIWWPRSLAGLVDTSTPLEISFTHSAQVDMTVEPGTAEMDAVIAVLAQHCYYRYWRTLPFVQLFTDYRLNIGGPYMSLRSIGGSGFRIEGEDEQFYLYPTGRRVGCLTDQTEEPGTVLFEELMAALRTE